MHSSSIWAATLASFFKRTGMRSLPRNDTSYIRHSSEIVARSAFFQNPKLGIVEVVYAPKCATMNQCKSFSIALLSFFVGRRNTAGRPRSTRRYPDPDSDCHLLSIGPSHVKERVAIISDLSFSCNYPK